MRRAVLQQDRTEMGNSSEQSTELFFKLKVTPDVLQGEFVW